MGYCNTVNIPLRGALNTFMKSDVFKLFRVGRRNSIESSKGTSLSLNIDLSSDAPCGGIDFEAIDRFIEMSFPYRYTLIDHLQVVNRILQVQTKKML